MKRNLLLLVVLAVAGIANLHAQCSSSNLQVNIKTVTTGPSGCQVTLDMSFTGDINNGNKFAFIHLWETAPVNKYPALTYVNPPTKAELADAIATIVIVDPGKPTASIYNQYPIDPTVPVNYAGMTLTKSGTTYTISNVVINFSSCNVPVTVIGDVWASQSNLAQFVHCENDGIITILFNNPVITGAKQCALPRLLNLNFENEHPTLGVSVATTVVIDNNSNGVIDAGDVDITSSLSPAMPNPMTIAPNSSQTFTGMSYSPYSAQPQYHNKPIIVQASASTPGAATVTITKSGITYLGSCTLLPVNFKSFTAKRDGSKVALVWETASEQNNSGFTVERNVNGVWTELSFVPSKAVAGNSNSRLVYTYDDVNAARVSSLYRIKQTDFDGVFTYSEIRTVAAEETMARTVVYPNPSTDGKVNIAFDEANRLRDISLIDMAGRTIKQWSGSRTNNLQIENLLPGMYSLRVIDRETGKQAVEKILINRR